MSKKSEIKLYVELDEKQLPEKIEWEATDAGFDGRKEASACMLSLWDKEEKVTLAIDLWTKEMLVEDMNIHFHQIFNKLADTYERSTDNREVGKMIREFSNKFADKLDIVEKVKKTQSPD